MTITNSNLQKKIMEKIEYRTCPVCGKIYRVKHVEKIMLGHILVKMQCEDNHEWLEHYSMMYEGYEHENVRYDSHGNKMFDLNT